MTAQPSPIIVWFRRDLRLSDHRALTAACQTGRPVIPVAILDGCAQSLGAAAKWRWGQGLEALEQSLAQRGSKLILRQGEALSQLQALIQETGATSVFWTRLYDPMAIERDTQIKASLKETGIEARSFGGHLMFEPWTVQTKTGGTYKVFTPMWRAVRSRDVAPPLPIPPRIAVPKTGAGDTSQIWPASDPLHSWGLDTALTHRGTAVLAGYNTAGELAARARLDGFLDGSVAQYPAHRDVLAQDGTSDLSAALSVGEISPNQCWHAAARAADTPGFNAGAEAFQRQLVWREFAYHLMYHTPHILTENWKTGWQGFPWITDPQHPHVRAWQQGRTGIAVVDAAMRQMYVTGRMHNRARMIAASYLTKHLMCDWRIGLRWFEDCLTDWDPACNAMGWQWVAGTGPDASPFFRVFNPDGQRAKFDPDQTYLRRWVAEGQKQPPQTALDYFNAVPHRWGLSVDVPYPTEIVSLTDGRKRALEAYQAHRLKML